MIFEIKSKVNNGQISFKMERMIISRGCRNHWWVHSMKRRKSVAFRHLGLPGRLKPMVQALRFSLIVGPHILPRTAL